MISINIIKTGDAMNRNFKDSTLGNTGTVDLWCEACGHKIEGEPYETSFSGWNIGALEIRTLENGRTRLWAGSGALKASLRY